MAKKNVMVTLMLSLTMVVGLQATAKTVAWYRFEEAPSGTRTTADSVIVNSVDPTKLPGHAKVQTPILWSGAQQLTTPESLMPLYTGTFNSDLKVVDPVSGEIYENNGALFFASADTSNHESAGSTVLIDNDAALHLKSMTIEFFVKIPAGTHSVDRYLLAQRSSNNSVFTWNVMYKNELVYAEIDANGTRYTVYDAYSHVNDGKWHHIAITIDDDSKTFSLYVDYQIQTWCMQKTYTGDICYDNAQPLALGPHIQCYYGIIEHTLDELRISDRVLGVGEFLRARPIAAPSAASTPETLFLLDFDGGTTYTVYTDFAKEITNAPPAYRNKSWPSSVWAEYFATTYTKSSVTSSVPVQLVGDVATALVRSSLAGTNFVTNAVSCLTSADATTNDWADSVVLPKAITRDMVFGDDVTIEVSFKLPSAGDIASSSGGPHLFCMLGGFQILIPGNAATWEKGMLSAFVGSTQLTGNWVNHPQFIPRNVRDDQWHHLAPSYDKTANRADLYLDGVWRLGADNIVFPDVGSMWYLYRRELMLGGSYYDERYVLNMHYDNLRITRGVLKPYQFLTSRAVECGAVLGWASYDDTFALTPYADFFATPAAAAFTTGGVAPVLDSDRPARTIFDGKHGEPVRTANAGSIRFNGSMLTYPGHDLVADQADVTVEFFLKSAAPVAGAGIVRLNRASENEAGDISWALSFADASGNLAVAVDTDTQTGQSHTFGGAFGDGAWHHVAVTFAADGDDTLVTVYRDYQSIGSYTFTGNMMCRFKEMNLMLGAGAVDVGFDGWIDELRITPGTLAVEDFLWLKRKGFTLLFK